MTGCAEELFDTLVRSEGHFPEHHGLAAMGTAERIGAGLGLLPLAPGAEGDGGLQLRGRGVVVLLLAESATSLREVLVFPARREEAAVAHHLEVS